MPETISLSSLGCGALEEEFQSVLSKVLANIDDPNVKPSAVRRITISFTFKPNKDRELAELNYLVDHSLAKNESTQTQIFIKEKSAKPGEFLAYEVNPNQLQMFEEPEKPAIPNNVTQLERKI